MTKSMKYGTTEFYVEKGSVSIAKKKSQKVRHFIGTDSNEVYALGKESTVITCNILVFGDTERIAIEQLLHGETETTLQYYNFYYKEVVTGESHTPVAISPKYDVWMIQAEFIALDPIPYNVSTDGALY